MVLHHLDDVAFRLHEFHDFSWLKQYGRAFHAIDQTGSGCICLGMQDADRKYFIKIAGVGTMEAEISPSESVAVLRMRLPSMKNLPIRI